MNHSTEIDFMLGKESRESILRTNHINTQNILC